jgi:hypothetical protein
MILKVEHLMAATVWAALLAAAVTAGVQIGRPITAPPAGASRVVLSVEKPAYLLGEVIVVTYCVENISSLPFSIEVGGDSRAAIRHQRFKVAMTDAAGATVPDPDPSGSHQGGGSGVPSVAPGDRWCQPLKLASYARFDQPGTYSIRVTHDLGWPKGAAPEGQAHVTLRMPTAEEASRLASTVASWPVVDDGLTYRPPGQPNTDYSTLRYPIYLAPLTRMVDAGDAAPLTGIGVIPTPDATRVLINFMTHSNRVVAREAVRWLAMRLPDPALDGALRSRNAFVNELNDPRRYLRDAGWRDEFAGEVRTSARRLLASSDAQDVISGAFMIEAIGNTGDSAAVSSALTRAVERTTTLPFERGMYPRPRGARQELLRASEVLLTRGYVPVARPESAGDIVLWLVAFARGARPEGWPERMSAMLSHDVPYIREAALARLPADAPSYLFAAVGPALDSPAPDLKIAALDLVARAKLEDHRDAAARIARTAQDDDRFLMRYAVQALMAIGRRAEALEIMADRLRDDENVRLTALGYLLDVFDDGIGGGGGFREPEEIPALVQRWRAFIARHRTEIDGGKKFSVDDPAISVDLVPRGYTIRLRGNRSWPPNR